MKNNHECKDLRLTEEQEEIMAKVAGLNESDD